MPRPRPFTTVLTSLVTMLLLGAALLPIAQAEQSEAASRRIAAASLAVGTNFSCALQTSGTVRCWGTNSFGQLGTTTNASTDNPNPVPGPPVRLGAEATAITAGHNHACALLIDGSVRCWGNNTNGAVGPGAPVVSTEPGAAVPLGGETLAIAAGGSFSCALLTDGAVRCWGNNYNGQLGSVQNNGTDAANPAPLEPVALGGRATAIAAGNAHACALLVSGDVRCWGSNTSGQLGSPENSGTSTAIPAPQPAVPLDARAVAITVAGEHSCALLTAGAVRCWGTNYRGQLGDPATGGDFDAHPDPGAIVALAKKATAISAGNTSTCALLSDGTIRCWGNNYSGQLGSAIGVGDVAAHPDPMAAVPLIEATSSPAAVAVSTGPQHTCGLLSTGAVRCWGLNRYGQLGSISGNGTDGTFWTPEPAPLRDVRTRAAAKLTMSVDTATDRRAPYRFALRGKVAGAFVADATICTGSVKIVASRKAKKIATASVALTPDCRWRTDLTIKPAKLVRGSNKLVLKARLKGNPDLTTTSAKTKVTAIR